MSTVAQTTDAIYNIPPAQYREHSVVWLYNSVRSHMERDHLPPKHTVPDEILKFNSVQFNIKSYVRGLVNKFVRKSA